MLDAISWANGTAQDNQDSPQVTEQMDQDEQPFEVPPEELDQLLDQIKSANWHPEPSPMRGLFWGSPKS